MRFATEIHRGRLLIELTGVKLRVARRFAFTCTSLNAPTIGDRTNTLRRSTGINSPGQIPPVSNVFQV